MPELPLSQRAKVIATITNRLGLHARPAMAFVDTATSFSSSITVSREDGTDGGPVDGKSIMEMMMLAATRGTKLVIDATGDDADAACAALKSLVDSGFGEGH